MTKQEIIDHAGEDVEVSTDTGVKPGRIAPHVLLELYDFTKRKKGYAPVYVDGQKRFSLIDPNKIQLPSTK